MASLILRIRNINQETITTDLLTDSGIDYSMTLPTTTEA